MKNLTMTTTLATALLVGCGGGGDSGGGGIVDPSTGKDQYMRSLPTWGEFAPNDLPAENQGAELVDETVPPTIVELTDPEGIVKVCTTEHISFYDTPDEYVMFSPPTNVLYPGAMIQGKSLRDGAGPGDLLPLLVDQRTPVQVSIPDCTITNNFRSVQPSLENVNSAVASILSEADSMNVNCASPAGSFKVETYRNEHQRALTAKISGKYLGYSGSASGSYSKTAAENSVAAVFRESLFRVQIEAPQSPGQWFSEAFTPALLQEQIDLGRIGENNIPAYVAEVVYGRMMKATMTSSHSEKNMKLTMKFKYENPVGSLELEGGLTSSDVLQDSEFTFAYYGGSVEATAAVLKSEDWNQYFGVPPTAADAVPVSFVIKSSIDNVPAVVQELTEYDRTTCFDKLADGGTFAFLDEQSFTPNFGVAGQTVASGDVDGDGHDDLVWASTGSRGKFAVSLSAGDGTFAASENFENTGASDFQGDFYMFVGDINDDGRDDVIFNVLPAGDSGNRVTVSFYDPSSTAFLHSAPQTLSTGGGWNSYKPYLAQMDGERGLDLLWNNTPNTTGRNRTYIARAVISSVPGSDPTSTALFVMSSPLDHPEENFSGYEYTHVADFTGDGRSDIVWHNIDANGNALYAAVGTPSGELDFKPYQNFGGKWSIYIALAGDANGDFKADLIQPRQKSPFNIFGTYFGTGTDIGSKVIGAHTFDRGDQVDDASIMDLLGTGDVGVAPDMYLADVDGNNSLDLIINDRGQTENLTNSIGVGLSTVGGAEFKFDRAAQSLSPLKAWSQYQVLIADVNGDLRDDILWVSNGPTNSVYVGVARAN